MSDHPSSIVEDSGSGLDADQSPPILTVGEISALLKRTVEETFPRVRVRGEISRCTRAASGHLYLTLKDEDAVLDGVCWRGTAGRLS
ncbi:MAG: exodeoxyribonuclease VII large subunit, partial [Proteobacteria bacterium]|nr:exodeoxyribonuclease VII large subunit [Pseudomonadota bacterium]